MSLYDEDYWTWTQKQAEARIAPSETDLDLSAFPGEPPLTPEQVRGESWFPGAAAP